MAETEYTKGFTNGRKYEANRILKQLITNPDITVAELIKLLGGKND